MSTPAVKRDEQTLANDIIEEMQKMFGKHAGLRPAHAKGMLLTGTFTPTADGATITKADHFNKFSNPSTPITVRFSSATGIPQLDDRRDVGHPRGIAVRFHLDGGAHTDIACHSTEHFPVKDGEEFQLFLQAVQKGNDGLLAFAKDRPYTMAFAQSKKTMPSSFLRDEYWSVTAFKFINGQGKEQYIRYVIVPTKTVDHLTPEQVAKKSYNYLYDDLFAQIHSGKPCTFRLLAQLADPGDNPHDSSVHWPEDGRRTVNMGEIKLEMAVPPEDQVEANRMIVFTPIPNVKGIEPSNDPLLSIRHAVYTTSGEQRRANDPSLKHNVEAHALFSKGQLDGSVGCPFMSCGT